MRSLRSAGIVVLLAAVALSASPPAAQAETHVVTLKRDVVMAPSPVLNVQVAAFAFDSVSYTRTSPTVHATAIDTSGFMLPETTSPTPCTLRRPPSPRAPESLHRLSLLNRFTLDAHFGFAGHYLLTR